MSMATTLTFAVLAACAALHQALAWNDLPKQTQWQKDLFERVEKKAAKLSEEATAVLLKRLDSDIFRKELAACCPSVSGLTAQELLQKLQDAARAAEVISGFPAVSKSPVMQPDSPGMSVADGLAGSFFQNAWQKVLLHTKHPLDVFHYSSQEYILVGCHHVDKSVTFQQWSSSGCTGKLIENVTSSQDQCMHDSEDQIIFRYTCENGTLYEEDWYDHQSGLRHARKQRHWIRGSPAYPQVKCPKKDPDFGAKYQADGACHAYTEYNASGTWTMEDNAEMHSYGEKPFKLPGAPQSLVEASERGPYSLVNNYLVDAGSPLYGDVSAVFSFRAMRRTALLSAIDTGYYQENCAQRTPIFNLHHNCSAYSPFQQLGTMEHFNHLLLINDNFWDGHTLLARRFSRMEGDWGSHAVSSLDLIHYWEAVPAGTLRYPEDIRFLIGSYPNLFGTKLGSQLQKWAKQRKWVLVWSLGLNLDGEGATMGFKALFVNSTFKANQRLIDPEVALESTAAASLSLANTTLDAFRRHWSKVHAKRLAAPFGYVSNETLAFLWEGLSHELPSRLHLRPLLGGDCVRAPDAPECVGMSADKQCICYTDNVLNAELLV